MQHGAGLNWEDGRLFLAVARSGQLLAAARVCGVSQATLSRRMTALEKAVGATLLVRRSTGCDLTDEGQALRQSLERIESEFIDSQSRIGSRSGALSGTIRIGAPDGFGVSFLAPRLGDFAARHPGLNIQLVPVPRTFSLSQREADIAVMVERPDQQRLVTRKLCTYSLGLYASAGYLERHPPPEVPGDLAGHRLIGYVEDLLYAPALAYNHEFWRGWQSQIEISSATGQLQATLSGGGITVLHDYLAAGHPDLRLVLPELGIERTYWTVFHESLRDNARVRACADFLEEAVRSTPIPFVRRNLVTRQPENT